MKSLWKMLKLEALNLAASCREKLGLMRAWVSMKDANDISKRHFEIGQKELENAKNKAKKDIDRRVIEEFEKSAREKARAVKASPKGSFKARLFIIRRIRHNLAQLLHPVRMLKKTKKTKKMAYTNGWTEVNGK